MAFDCSGLIDVNCAGGAIRNYGTNSSELALSNRFFSGMSSSFLTERKNEWIRFESIAEIDALTALSPSNVFVYSYAPMGYLEYGGNRN